MARLWIVKHFEMASLNNLLLLLECEIVQITAATPIIVPVAFIAASFAGVFAFDILSRVAKPHQCIRAIIMIRFKFLGAIFKSAFFFESFFPING